MPVKSKGKVASPLHAILLKNLRAAIGDGPIKAGMERAGSSEQYYNNIQNGASPTVEMLEGLASKLGSSVLGLLGGARGIFTTPQSAEIASYIDDLPEEARIEIARSVHAQSIMWRTGAVRARAEKG